jgi:hypothetical protein
VRGAPDGVSQDTRYLTYLFESFVWIVVVLAACAEAFVAGLSAMRARPDGPTALSDRLHPRRDHHRDLIFAYSSILGASPQQIG